MSDRAKQDEANVVTHTVAVNELPEPRNIQPWSMSGDNLDWTPEDGMEHS